MGKFKDFKKIIFEGLGDTDSNTFDELEDRSYDVTVDELHDLIDYIDEIDYDAIADLILDYIDMNYEAEPEIEDDEDDEEIEEGMATKFTGKKKGVRKFAISKAKLRQNRKKNKAVLRKNRVKNRIKRKKNKIKIKKYQTSRNKAIKAGQHQAKIHRGK